METNEVREEQATQEKQETCSSDKTKNSVPKKALETKIAKKSKRKKRRRCF